MPSSGRISRQSISLPDKIAKRVKALARSRGASTSRVMAELIQSGLESAEAKKRRFFGLADQLTKATDLAERQRIKEELVRMTFGE